MSYNNDATYMIGTWLDASDKNHHIALALGAGNYTTTRRLEKLVRTPGLIDKLRYIDPTDGLEKELNEEEKEEIAGLWQYQNWLRNEYGFITGDKANPLDIRNYDRNDYLDFISSIYDVNTPIKYDHGKATARKREAELHKLAVDAAQQRITAAATATAGIMAGGGAGNSSGNSTGGNTTTTNTSLSSGNNNTYTYDPAAEKLKNLKKTIKPDPTKFKDLTDENNFAEWRDQFVPEASLQDFDNVMNKNYVPSPGTETELFKLQNKLFYSILSTVLKTTKGKDIISGHTKDSDGQEVWSELEYHHTESPIAKSNARRFHQLIVTSVMNPLARATDEIYRFRSYMRAFDSFSPTPLSDDDKNTHLDRFCAHSQGIQGVADMTSLMEGLTGKSLSAKEKTNLTEHQALLLDTRPVVPPSSGRRQVNLTEFQEPEEFVQEDAIAVDFDDGFITILVHSVDGPSKYSHRVPKSTWNQLPQKDRDAWLSVGTDSRKLLLRCLLSNDEEGSAASSVPSAPRQQNVRQHTQPRGQSRYHQRTQRTVRIADQFAPVEEHDEDLISDDVVPDVDPPSNATDLQVNTTRLIPDGSLVSPPLIDSGANKNILPDDNLFIRSVIQNKVKAANPFEISRLLSDQQWNGKNGEVDAYCPRPVQPTSTSTTPPPRVDNNNNNSNSTKPKKSILKKFSRGNKGVKSVVNNAFIGILMCICFLGCLPHSSASAYDDSNSYEGPQTYECRPTMWVDSSSSSSSTITVSRSTHTYEGAVGNTTVDSGANGCIGGKELRVISTSDRTINVVGIDSHMLQSLPICTLAGVVDLPDGPVMCYFHQYAYHANGHTIHSKVQLMDYGNFVDDSPIKLGGTQKIVTPCGITMPLDMIRGIAYLKLRRPTDNELATLEPIHMTRDEAWDPSKYDSAPSADADWFAAIADSILEPTSFDSDLLVDLNNISAYVVDSIATPRDYEKLRPYFLGIPSAAVKQTYDATTQYYSNFSTREGQVHMYKSPFPAANVFRTDEDASTDTLYSDTTAWGGATCMQLFVGSDSYYIRGYECKSDGEFARILQDDIRFHGAPNRILSDRALALISNKVQDILRKYHIDAHQSEPYQQQQNPIERFVQDVKRYANYVYDYSDAPPESWVLIIHYVTYIMNRTARSVLNNRTPYEKLYGQTPDISILTKFQFWEPVLIHDHITSFPSTSTKILVRFVGFAESVGNAGCYIVFNEATGETLNRACLTRLDERQYEVYDVKPYPSRPNGEPDDVPTEELIKSRGDTERGEPSSIPIGISQMLNRTFLLRTDPDGTRRRARITEVVEEFEGELDSDPKRVKFKAKIGDNNFEELIEYNDLMELIEEQKQFDNGTWRMRKILDHRKPRTKKDKWNVLIEWESGERTWEPIKNIFTGDKYMLAEYARDHDLLDKWDGLYKMKIKAAAKNSKTLLRMVRQAKLKSFRTAPVYKNGHKVPRNHQQAMALDRINDNTNWADAEKLEKNQLFEYETFDDRGHKSSSAAPGGYKKINLHFVYDVKHDGRFKARVVAGGHLTETPVESIYSGVVSLRGIRIVTFIAELNNLKVWQTDIGNAYLEAYTNEKVYVIAGPEFGELEGHIFVIRKALYGLKTSSIRWHERFSGVLRDMGFLPSFAEPDIWMRDMGDHYEYIATYVDDLTIASRDPQAIIDVLESEPNNFKLKGTGDINVLLGCNFFRDGNGLLCYSPKNYLKKMEEQYELLFGVKPKHHASPLEENDHPELDESDFLDENETRIYQSLIGCTQWLIQLGRFDIAVHVGTLSSFRAKPRRGHLDRIKRVIGYLSKMCDSAIRIRTDMPDVSDAVIERYDWSKTVYAGAKEEVPHNIPEPKGKPVKLITYADSNLMHNILDGKAITGILHFVNQTPFDWFSKKQATAETATYGAEELAGRTAIEQCRANRLTFHYLGVPIEGPSILLGDNESVVKGVTIPHRRLSKRHLMLSWHYLREAIATGTYDYVHIPGKINPADILSKHWGYRNIWSMLKPILFWFGNTGELIE